MNRVVVLLLEERHLERQYREQLVDVVLYLLDAILLPRPYLRRDIVVDRYLGMLVYELRNLEVEARIVDKNHGVGPPLHDVALAERHVAQNSAQVEQYGDDAHVRQFAVVAHACASDSRHHVAAEEAKLSFRVFFEQSLHKMRGVQVARCLANY